jgi:2-(1,2-epoxy-1,2-dihydrophenyl)acetyl-CoA isomerase
MGTSPQIASPAPVIERREGAIATVLLNRPERLNAINKDLAEALNSALERLAAEREIRVVVLGGTGRAFCAGGDLEVMRRGYERGDTKDLEPILRGGMQAVLKIRSMPQPVIAAVQGPAAGAGMNLALAADLRVASEEATFGQNFAKVGLFPDYGGTFLLPELIGPARAAEMFYTGDMLDAQTALRLGIVNRVAPLAELQAEVQALAQKIADGPPLVIAALKQTLFGRTKEDLRRALELEVRQQRKCFRSEDGCEGIRAFWEKRKPTFRGQ